MVNFGRLSAKSLEIRQTVFNMVLKNGGHLASSFSAVEILVVLYYSGILKHNPENPGWGERDIFILSKGHAETLFYAVLADRGFFPKEWLFTRYRAGDLFLGGHPDIRIPGVEITSGSLGHGAGIAAGMAYAFKCDGKGNDFFVLLGDGECSEGSVWEATLFAAKRKLDNITFIIDRNRIGSIDFVDAYAELEPFSDKWKSFGFNLFECCGHDCGDLYRVFSEAKKLKNGKPSVVIANTVKGKGISFVENEPIWHVKRMEDEEEIKRAKEELGL